MIIDQSARTLLHILRSTQYLVWYYRECHEGPKMGALKLALIDTIAELEAAGADQPRELIPLAVNASLRFKAKPTEKTK